MDFTGRNRPYALSVVFVLAACAALAIDVPVAQYAEADWLVGDVRKILDVSEVFAHGLGVLMILITVAVLDPKSRRRLPRVAACAYGAGLVAQVLKHFVPRVRPNALDTTAADALSTFLSYSAPVPEQVRELGSSAIQSFPSGHAATAVGLAFGLAWLYPRGRWLFAIFATLAATQRIEASAHFVSDTLAAAAFGCLVAGLLLNGRGLGRWFAKRETGGWRREAGGWTRDKSAE